MKMVRPEKKKIDEKCFEHTRTMFFVFQIKSVVLQTHTYAIVFLSILAHLYTNGGTYIIRLPLFVAFVLCVFFFVFFGGT